LKRPWPWVLRMNWEHTLFMHWSVPPARVEPLLPRDVQLDTFSGEAWVSVLPFLVTDFHPRGVPAPLRYGQVNVRTYVRVNGTPGIWTFSLDAASLTSVLAARLAYRLPYRYARVSLSRRRGGWFHVSSERVNGPGACLVAYRPVGRPAPPRFGTLDHFLTERRSLFATWWDGRPWSGDVQHEPWPLQPAEVLLHHCDLPDAAGIRLGGPPVLAHYAPGVHAVAWPPRKA